MSADDKTSLEAAPHDGTQRLDKWLWFARVVKSRTLASKLVADGGVRLNKQRVEKPSTTVRVGDVLTIGVHDRVRICGSPRPASGAVQPLKRSGSTSI